MAGGICTHTQPNLNRLTVDLYTGGTPDDFLSYAIYKQLPPFCNPNQTYLTDPCAMWNCNLCGNDRAYFIPYTDEDYLYFEFFEHDTVSPTWEAPTLLNFKVYINTAGCDCNATTWTELTLDGAAFIEAYNAIDPHTLFNYQVFRIKGSAITALLTGEDSPCCTMFKFEFYSDAEFKDIAATYYSEAYRKVNCEATVLLKGLYTNQDCDGFYYGSPGAYVAGTYTTIFNYSNEVRVYGKLTKTGATVEMQKDEYGVLSSSKQADVYELKGRPVPPYMAEWLQRIYTSSAVLFDNYLTLYLNENAYNKQIEYSRMWRNKTQFASEKCQLYYSCQ